MFDKKNFRWDPTWTKIILCTSHFSFLLLFLIFPLWKFRWQIVFVGFYFCQSNSNKTFMDSARLLKNVTKKNQGFLFIFHVSTSRMKCHSRCWGLDSGIRAVMVSLRAIAKTVVGMLIHFCWMSFALVFLLHGDSGTKFSLVVHLFSIALIYRWDMAVEDTLSFWRISLTPAIGWWWKRYDGV